MSTTTIRAALDAAEQHATAEIWVGHPLAIILAALIKQTRDALAAEPAGGEAGELAADLNEIAQILCGMEKHRWAVKLTRAATLLQQQVAPAPAVVAVPVDERLPGEGEVIVRFEFEVLDEHDQTMASGDAPTLEEAAREGHHYLQQYQQDGPCTLELRRVEVLDSDAIPLPQAGEGDG